MRNGSAQRGFTYLGLIIFVTVIGLVGAATLKIGALEQRVAAEEELLAIGAQFSDALRSYAAATPPGQPQQPPTLQELLRDPRFPNPRRHLRKIFVDPLTGKADWGVMYVSDKLGVIGVYSLAEGKPFKVANFDARFLNMENKASYSEWKFTLSSQTMPALAGGTDKEAQQPPLGVPPAMPPQAPPEPPLVEAAPVQEAPPPEEPMEEPEKEERDKEEQKEPDEKPDAGKPNQPKKF